MSDLTSAEYYKRREQQERHLGQAAISPGIAAIHLSMADRYRELIQQADRTPYIRLVTPA